MKVYKEEGVSAMKALVQSSNNTEWESDQSPFLVYPAHYDHNPDPVKPQFNKPRLICILERRKKIETDSPQLDIDRKNAYAINLESGSFIFFSDDTLIRISEILEESNAFALVIEFEPEDFDCFAKKDTTTQKVFHGSIDSTLQQILKNFVELSTTAPRQVWPSLRQEVLQHLYHSGYKQIATLAKKSNFHHKLYELIDSDKADNWSTNKICEHLAISKSTLQRKLASEGVRLQQIKDSVKLNYAIHIVRTTIKPIHQVALLCGYLSQSRFTNKFKKLHGITPTELRKVIKNYLG
jgi:AraC-like DNA-binding protein